MYDILKKFWQEVKDIIEKYQLKEIYVNVYIGCVLQDSFDFVFSKEEKHINSGEPYNVGKFNSVDVIVNPYMKYTDLRIMNAKGEVYYNFSEEYKNICLI